MKKNLWRLSLLLSFSLNVFTLTLIGRVSWVFSNVESLDFRIEFAADRLQLTEEQRVEFLRLARSYHDADRRLLPARERAADELMALGRSSENDLDGMDAAIQSLQQADADLSDERREYAVKLLGLLNPEQREFVFDFRHHPPAHMRGAPLGPVLELLPPGPVKGPPIF